MTSSLDGSAAVPDHPSSISEPPMKVYEFDVFLKDVSEVTDDLAGALLEAGCDDGSFASRDGCAWVHFDREANSLEEAIRSAIADIQSAGLTASGLTMDVDAMTALEQ